MPKATSKTTRTRRAPKSAPIDEQKREWLATYDAAPPKLKRLMLLVAQAFRDDLPSDQPDSRDAELIRQCARLVCVHLATECVYETFTDETERDRWHDQLHVVWMRVKAALFELPFPATLEGTRAVAKAMLTQLPRDRGEEAVHLDDLLSWLSLGCASYLDSLPAPAIATAPQPGADAALLNLCRQMDADTRELQRNDRPTPAQCEADPTLSRNDDALVPRLTRWNETVGQIIVIPARTMAGIRAKAGALGHALLLKAFIDTKLSPEEQGEDYEQLAMSLVRDLAGEVAPGPDDELIRLCTEAMRQDGIWETSDREAGDRAGGLWFELTGVIAATPARTVEGMRAKAGIIYRLMEPMQPRWAAGDNEDQTIHDPLVWSLVNDLAMVPV